MYDLQPQSPFFTRLPPEIRSCIYRYCGYDYMTYTGCASITSNRRWQYPSCWPRFSSFPKLLCTCKRIAKEARSIVYENAVLCLAQQPCSSSFGIPRHRFCPTDYIRAVGTWSPAMVRDLYIIYRGARCFSRNSGPISEKHLRSQLEAAQRAFKKAANVKFIHLHLDIREGAATQPLDDPYIKAVTDFIQRFPELNHLLVSGHCGSDWLEMLRSKMVGVRVGKSPQTNLPHWFSKGDHASG